MISHSVPDGFARVTRRTPCLDLGGPLWARDGDDDLDPVYGLLIDDRHANGRGGAHGAILMPMADVVPGYTTASSQEPPVKLTTASMSIDFASSAKIGDWVEGRVDIQRIGRTLAFVTPTSASETGASFVPARSSPSPHGPLAEQSRLGAGRGPVGR
jgi:acyl-coenzyme A thioesterase 13